MLKIRSYPLSFGENSTPYFKVIFSELDGLANIERYRPKSIRSKCDVLHIHWLENIFHEKYARLPGAAKLMYANLGRHIDETRRRGGLVWTAHNLKPHEQLAKSRQKIWSDASQNFYAKIDFAIAMSDSHIAKLVDEYPEIESHRWRVIPHPHYRTVYKHRSEQVEVRKQFGIPDDAFVLAMVGNIREYKAIPEAITLFSQTAKSDEYLIVAGFCGDAHLQQEIAQISAVHKNIILKFKQLDPLELVDVYTASNVGWFNFSEILNSGSIMTSLSLDRPILALQNDLIDELDGYVGDGWVASYPRPITAALFRSKLDQVRERRPSGLANLERHDPKSIALKHFGVYSEAAALRG